MYIKYYITISLLLWSGWLFAQVTGDTIIKRIDLEEVVVSSTKETNKLEKLPGSISLISPQMIEGQKITSVVDLSTVIPNFFIPVYGSKMSTPVYIRGIGERSTGQSIGLYVDNMPYLDKSVFNFEFMDIQRIEVLRGPQGTLYGRNALSGIVNIYTHSPLDYERTKITLTGGNYGLFRAHASVAKTIGQNVGLSVSGYYDGNNGFFENQYDGERADQLRSAGGRLRVDWRMGEHWTAQWMANYDYSDQGAFPYGQYTDGEIAAPNYNYPGKYIREVTGSNLNLGYRNDKIIFTSSTGFMYFDDDMRMDTDYDTLSYFTLNQLQKETNWTQEFTVKSNTKSNYQWSFGAFGFSNDLRTDVVTTIYKDALQPILDAMVADNPNAPKLEITDNEMPIPGTFKTPAYGAAVFHQSTYNNLLAEGLSLTAGIRLDYEKTKLDYNTSMLMHMNVVVNPRVTIPQEAGTDLVGSGSMSFTEWLPKVALKYEFDKSRYIYASATKGYKAGGYNIQMFADVVRSIVETKCKSRKPQNPIPEESPDAILASVSYSPEYSWNYELGFKGEVVKDLLYAETSVFYVDVSDVLITQFVESGQGRLLKNAGSAESMGFDLGLTAHLLTGLTLTANYGYSHAVFKDYQKDETTDYSGNYIPFAPQNTFSLCGAYNRGVHSRLIDRFNIQAQYNGVGKIYWTEANDVSQDFYGLLNLKAGVTKGIFGLSVWTKNTLNTEYAAFYFETESQNLAQKGNPFQIGVDLTVSF